MTMTIPRCEFLVAFLRTSTESIGLASKQHSRIFV